MAGAPAILIDYGQATDPGLDPHKQVNEDAAHYAETRFGHLFVLCDGMGGHVGGKQASEIAIRTVFEVMEQYPNGAEPREALAQAIEEAARRVYAFGGPAGPSNRPGSTCVALLLHDGRIDTAHVGDSRAYAIRGQQIYRLTKDHSMVQSLLDQGLISEREAIGHPDGNKITRALGMTPEVEVELQPEPMELYDGDVFLLASDGLTDLARNEDILVTVNEYLRTSDVGTACKELIALANRRGGHDNITVQVVRVLSAGPKTALTQIQEPGGPFAGQRVATTLPGAPASDPPPGMRPLTAMQAMQPYPPPDRRISPTIVDATLRDSGQRPAVRRPEASRHTLIYVILVMAGVIGVLLMLLTYAWFFR